MFQLKSVAMKKNRLLVILGASGIGLTFGYFALMRSQEPAVPERIVETVTINSVDVLVAKTEIPAAAVLDEKELIWQPWPIDAARGLVSRIDRPNAASELSGAVARTVIAAGEPIRAEKLLDKGSRFMSVMLAPGKRAVAIPLDQTGNTTAGGFVLPNDYVDVIRVEISGQRTAASQTILSNIRVLAIGPNVGEKAGEKVVLGQTATLELDPEQAEFLISAMQGASIVLALRGLNESGQRQVNSEKDVPLPARTIFRAGVATTF